MAENSKKTAKPRGKGRPFKKGQTGNAGGRPKIPKDVKQAFTEMNPKAARRLAELLESYDEKVAMRAVEYVIDRNLGRVPQGIELTGKDGGPIHTAKVDTSKLTVEQLKQLRELVALASPTAQA